VTELRHHIEGSPWSDQIASDDGAYREQISFLVEKSQFYRDKLTAAGFTNAKDIGGLADISELPFTEKDELRASRSAEHPIGTHLAVPMAEIARIYSTSGTTGTPSYIPLTRGDLDAWIETSCRSYGASGVKRGERMVTTYNAGPFVAGVAMDAFTALGVCHIPVGAGNTERLMGAIQNLHPTVLGCTPSYALHLAEWAAARGVDLAASSVNKILVAGEPGGGEPHLRARLQEAWGAAVTEAMGIGDISISLWGECTHQTGMHFSGRGFVHAELIDPASGASLAFEDGAEGELVYTHLRHRAAPLLRFRSRDHVRVQAGPCPCGRTAPRIRCIGRTDDMLIVRGVNLYPTAVREVIGDFGGSLSGVFVIRPKIKGVKQPAPLPIVVELAEGGEVSAALAQRISARLREVLVVSFDLTLLPHGTLPRTDYKSKLIDWSDAS
jgi:phenylacetate-CoA ligase